jgi:protein phosphatase
MSDKGRTRATNEDYCLFRQEKGLYVVTDGMGGHNAGEVASEHAAKEVDGYLVEERLSDIRGNGEKIREEMILCLKHVHAKILELAETQAGYAGMGCTIVVAFVDGNLVHISHVGDARAYVCDPDQIRLLTMDHSYVMELVKEEQMTLEEARNSPLKNELLQAIGGSPVPISPDYSSHTLKDGDKLLLCSDGLWDMLTDQQIHEIVAAGDPPKIICDKLIQTANNSGGQDNIAVVVVEYRDIQPLAGSERCCGAAEIAQGDPHVAHETINDVRLQKQTSILDPGYPASDRGTENERQAIQKESSDPIGIGNSDERNQ